MKLQALRTLALSAIALAATAATAAPIRVAVLQKSAISSADAAGRVVAQLNDSSSFDIQATHITLGSALDSAAELAAYDVVLLGDDGYGGSQGEWNTAGAAIKSWVLAGGALVTTGWTVYWSGLNGDIASLLPVSGAYQYASNATIDINGSPHAVTAGVTDFVSPSYSNYGTLRDGATALATIAGQSSAAAVAAWEQGDGRVVHLASGYMFSGQTYGGVNGLSSGEADQLLEQSVAWASQAQQAVPEPGSLALAGLALAACVGLRRRRA